MIENAVSVFTPAHSIKYLLDAYGSIREQSYNQWVIIPNHGITAYDIPADILKDPRTKVVQAPANLEGVGALKKFACSQCDGSLLVEFDYDDLLVNNAIQRIKQAFVDPNVVFAYSNCAEFNHPDKSIRTYGDGNGWKYRDFYYKGDLYKEAISPELTPYHASLILWAPNHFRAFRKTVYDAVGGHNPDLTICDDQDLMCRLYQAGNFAHIDECCYLYRVHGENSWLQMNSNIQTTMFDVQKKYIRPMAECWAKKNGYKMLDLGGRFSCPEGYESVDLKNADITCDLNERWPFEDSSVGIIRASDIIEHLPDQIHTMSELHRVLIPGGYAFIDVPSTDGRGAWQDPSHVSYWNQNSFWYYTRREQAQYIDNTSIRFKAITLETNFPNDWCKTNNIPYVRADLLCLKDGYRPMGYLEI